MGRNALNAELRKKATLSFYYNFDLNLILIVSELAN